MNKKIDLKNIPLLINGKFNWKKSIGMIINFEYNNIYGQFKIINYENRYLYIKYRGNPIFKIQYKGLIKCQLGNLLKERTPEFKFEINDIINDRNRKLIILDKKKENVKMYKYRCQVCGYEGWIRETSILKNTCCSSCSCRSIVKGFNDIATTAPWMIKYFVNKDDSFKYTKSSRKTIKVKCPECGREKNIKLQVLNYRKSIGCTYCNDGFSYPEKFMFFILTKFLGNDFIYQLSKKDFSWIGKYKYDFYFKLNNKEYIIETDGYLHKVEQYKKIDRYKDEIAKKNNIEVIRIDCYYSKLEFIKENILNSKLNEIFNFKKVNWFECHNFAILSKIKEVCEYKKNNHNLSIYQIGNILNLSYVTVKKYLIQGDKLGLCEYNKEKEKLIHKKNNSKQIGIFKDNKLLKVFLNARDLEDKSEKLFGVKMYHTNIYKVCTGKKNQYKGFTFKYI